MSLRYNIVEKERTPDGKYVIADIFNYYNVAIPSHIYPDEELTKKISDYTPNKIGSVSCIVDFAFVENYVFVPYFDNEDMYVTNDGFNYRRITALSAIKEELIDVYCLYDISSLQDKIQFERTIYHDMSWTIKDIFPDVYDNHFYSGYKGDMLYAKIPKNSSEIYLNNVEKAKKYFDTRLSQFTELRRDEALKEGYIKVGETTADFTVKTANYRDVGDDSEIYVIGYMFGKELKISYYLYNNLELLDRNKVNVNNIISVYSFDNSITVVLKGGRTVVFNGTWHY